MKKLLGLLLVVCFMVPMLAGCGAGTTSTNEEDWYVVQSTESYLQLKVPKTWAGDPTLNSDASIAVGNDSAGRYFMVIEEPKEDFEDAFSLKDYADLVHDNMQTAVSNPVSSEVTISSTLPDGAYQFDIQGSVDSVKVRFIVNFVEHNGRFYQLIGYCKNSDYAKALVDFENVFKSVAFSE